jgi:hypothetical protein
MKKIKKMLLVQIIIAVLLLLLIVLLYLQRYINYLPYTEITLENTTIIARVIEALR